MHYDSWNTKLNACLVEHINANTEKRIQHPEPAIQYILKMIMVGDDDNLL